MANWRIATATRNAMLDEVNNRLNGGPAAAKIRIYDGSQPANADTALSGQTQLAEVTLNDPAADVPASGGVLNLDVTPVPEDASADATGTATWARALTSDNVTVFDCDVSATGGGGSLQFNTVSFVAGGPVRITAFSFTIPAA